MTHYENRMMKGRTFVKDSRGTVTKPGTVDLLGKWKDVSAVDNKRPRLSLARRRLDLAIAKQPLTITINRMKT